VLVSSARSRWAKVEVRSLPTGDIKPRNMSAYDFSSLLAHSKMSQAAPRIDHASL
jgi:hypothetical protein